MCLAAFKNHASYRFSLTYLEVCSNFLVLGWSQEIGFPQSSFASAGESGVPTVQNVFVTVKTQPSPQRGQM